MDFSLIVAAPAAETQAGTLALWECGEGGRGRFNAARNLAFSRGAVVEVGWRALPPRETLTKGTTMHLTTSFQTLALLTASAMLGACGDGTAGGAGGSSGTGAGGASSTGPAQAAWTAHLLSNGGACSITSSIGQGGAVTASTKDKLIVDGGFDSASVACAVKGTTSFSVHGQAKLQSQSLTIDIPSIDATATVTTPAKGTSSFAASATGGVYTTSAGTSCDFYFTPGTGEGIASGRVWISFKCPAIINGQSTCELAESVAIFESCTE